MYEKPRVNVKVERGWATILTYETCEQQLEISSKSATQPQVQDHTTYVQARFVCLYEGGFWRYMLCNSTVCYVTQWFPNDTRLDYATCNLTRAVFARVICFLVRAEQTVWIILRVNLHSSNVIGLKHHVFSPNGPFAPEGSRGTAHWRANDALGHVKQRKFKFDGLCLDWTRKVRIGCVALLKVVNPLSLQNLPHIFELESSPSADKLW